jgi:hypothetical protein
MNSSNTYRMKPTHAYTRCSKSRLNIDTRRKSGAKACLLSCLPACLLYEPNKKYPHNIALYIPIALMNGIL